MKLTCLSPGKTKLKRRYYYARVLIIVIYLVSISNVSINAITINSIASGAWDDPNAWVGGNIPGASDDVIILSGHTINLTDTRTCNSMNIATGGKLTEGNSGVLSVQTSCTVSGTMTLLSPIIINQIITLNGTCNLNNGNSVFGANTGFSGSGTLSLNSGNATFNSGSTLNILGIIITAGSFTDNIGLDLYNVNLNNTANVGVFGGSANTIIHGTFNWMAGTIGGSGNINITDSLACSTTNQKALQESKKIIIEHAGSLNNSGMILSGTAILKINSGAAFYLNSTSNAFILNGNSNTLLDIESGGALIKNGTNNLTIKSLINLAGNILVNSGSLVFDINTTQNIVGSIVNNAILYTIGGGPYNFTNAVFGSGTFKIDNSISNFNSGSSITNNILLQSGTFNDNIGLTLNDLILNGTSSPCIFGGNGNTIINGILTWTSGTIQGSGTITLAGILTGSGNGSRFMLDSKKIIITQTAEITNGDLRIGGTSILQINNGASLTMNANTTDYLLGISSTALLDLQTGGQLIKNGANSIDLLCPMNMNGNITINNGTLRLWGNGTQTMNGLILNNGTLNVYNGGPYNFVNAISGSGIFKLNNVTANFNTGSSITNDIIIETGNFNDNIGLTVPNVTIVGTNIPCNWGGAAANTSIGILTWTNGNIIGSGNITITSLLSCVTASSRQLTNSKKLIIVQNAVFTNTGLTLLGTSILQINSGANMIVNANSSNLEIGSDVNSKIDIQSGANLIKNGANHFNITSLFIFNGILTINSGTINFFSSGTQTFNGNVFNNGTLNIASGGPYNFVNTLSGAGIFKVSGGIVNFNNGSSTTNEIIIENGTFNDNIGLNLNNVTVKGGVLSGPGSPVINGILNWSAGTISGSGTLTVITANFSNTLFLTTKTFKLTGVGVNLNNNSFILFLSSANFVIEQGASYTSNNSTSTSEEIRDNSITSLIINKGVITKSGSGTFTLSAPLNQETTGETDIYQGILTLNKDGGIYGAISNSATLNIQITGGLNFLGPGFNNSGTITSNALKFGASTLQELENNGTMAQLIVNNSLLSINGRQTITNAITINSGCTISEGVLDIGSLPLTGMGPSNYIKTLGAGSLRRIVPISGTNTQFPMGYGNSYNPVIIKLTSGSANQLFGVGISNELGGSDFGDEHVNRQWYIDNLSFGTITATLTLQWNAADEDPAFDRSNCFIIRREDFWETMQTNGPASTVSPGVYTRTAAELTQFSYWSIGSPGFLPVELVSFTGRTDDSKNILNWKTASEKNTSLFIVERSEDGYSNWSEVAHIKAFGNSNTEKLYSVFDENPFNESYYRLKILDFGGKYSYSKIIQIKRNNEFDSYIEKLWPNPFNNNLTLELFNKLESSEAKVQILNFQGELVYEKELESSENKQEINLDLVKLPDGPYIIQLINERIKPIQTKIIKCKSL